MRKSILTHNSIISISAFLLLLSSPSTYPSGQQDINRQGLAERIVEQLSLQDDETVLIVNRKGLFEAIIPHIRYAVMAHHGIDISEKWKIIYNEYRPHNALGRMPPTMFVRI